MISSKLFEKYFGYSSPSDMYKTLNETRNLEENKAEVNTIENRLTNLMEYWKVVPQVMQNNNNNNNNNNNKK